MMCLIMAGSSYLSGGKVELSVQMIQVIYLHL